MGRAETAQLAVALLAGGKKSRQEVTSQIKEQLGDTGAASILYPG